MRQPYAQVYRVGGTDGEYRHMAYQGKLYVAPSTWRGTVWGAEGGGVLAETLTYNDPRAALEALAALAGKYGVADVRPWSGEATP